MVRMVHPDFPRWSYARHLLFWPFLFLSIVIVAFIVFSWGIILILPGSLSSFHYWVAVNVTLALHILAARGLWRNPILAFLPLSYILINGLLWLWYFEEIYDQ